MFPSLIHTYLLPYRQALFANKYELMWDDVHRVCNFNTQIHVRQLRRSTINPAAQLNILDLLQRDTNRKRRRPSVICVRKQYEP